MWVPELEVVDEWTLPLPESGLGAPTQMVDACFAVGSDLRWRRYGAGLDLDRLRWTVSLHETGGVQLGVHPETKAVTASYPVIEAWASPVESQDPHPGISIAGNIAYVTEPATDSIHAVDLTTGKVTVSSELDVTPNEFVAVTD